MALDDYKKGKKAAIDSQAERLRWAWITPGPGQALSYREKVTEAQALQSDATPDPNNYPILNSEVGLVVGGALVTSLGNAAERVLTTFSYWKTIEATINNKRLKTKAEVDTANSESQVDTIVNSFMSWVNSYRSTAP